MTDLLPCPFCGAPARTDLLPHSGGPGWVQCSECECDRHMSDTLEQAVARWNTRATPSRPVTAGAREALEPFATAWNSYGDKPSDDTRLADNKGGAYLEACLLTFGDLRRAAEALALTPQDGGVSQDVAADMIRAASHSARHRTTPPAPGADRAAVIEECAKVADDQTKGWVHGEAVTVVGQAYQRACRNTAAAIRALALPRAERVAK